MIGPFVRRFLAAALAGVLAAVFALMLGWFAADALVPRTPLPTYGPPAGPSGPPPQVWA